MVNLTRVSQLLRPAITSPERGKRLTWLLGRGSVQTDRDAFFVWQERALDVLLSWGIGNVIAGAVITATRPGFPRAIAVQALAWGTVDTAMALYAECTARRNAASARSGLYGARHIRDRARRFEYWLAAQTAADVVYVVAGSIVAARSHSVWVRGTAIGVIIQGGALLIYDMSLVVRMLRRPELRFKELDID